MNHFDFRGPNRAPGETEPPLERDDFGILFVHGIGTQRRGDVLLQCGEAVNRWLERWADGAPDGRPGVRPQLVDAHLSDGERAGTHPASARLILGDSTWLMAESHWAESFRAPTYLQLLTWAFVALPRAMFLHAFNPVRSFREALELRYRGERDGLVAVDAVDHESNVELAMRTFGATATLFAAPLVILSSWIALGAIFALKLIPVAATQSIANRIQRTLTATLGDSLLFSTNAMTEAAVVTRVQTDLAWLAERCKKVVLVAHSQGAAVSHELLQRLRSKGAIPGNLDRFITYGSGLRKLSDLKQSSQSLARLTLFGWAATGLAAVLVLLVVRLIASPSIWLALGLVLPFVAMTLLVVAASVLIDRPEPERPLPLEWLDYYGSRDPVPNGPVDVRFWGAAGTERFDTQNTGGSGYRRRSIEVFNEHSLLRDHTIYWAAGTADFMARVMVELTTAGGPPLISEEESAAIADWAKHRQGRPAQLAGLRLATLVAAGSTLLWQLPTVDTLGATTAGWMRTVCGRLWNVLSSWLCPMIEWAGQKPLLVGTFTLALTLATFYAIGRLGWNIWQARELDLFFRRQGAEAARRGGVGRLLFWAGWAGLIAAPVVLVSRLTPGELSIWLPAVGLLWAALRLFPGPWIFETATRGPRRAGTDR